MPAAMSEFQNRTLICSVLFIDIVEYSRKSVVEQGQVKDRFNEFLSTALRGVALNDRIILDTGDGAAISFIGDPEDALFVATALRDEIARYMEEDGKPELATRMGVNLGPVRLVKDINGQPNIIGDGINVAQRVMTFAQPGQVLVSRSYYEIVSRLSEEASKLFSYEGARTDKHIREHEVYAVGAFPAVRRRYESAPRSLGSRVKSVFKSPRTATLASVLAMLIIAFFVREYRDTRAAQEPEALAAAAGAQTAAAPEPEKPLPPIKGLPPEPPKPLPEAQPAAAEMKAAPVEKPKADRAPAKSEIVVREAPPKQPPKQLPAETSNVAIAAPAQVSFAVAPWAEVYVDGKMLGVSPPLQEIEVAPGRHRVELRNSASQPHVVTINAKPGERLRIKHKFN